MHQEVELVPNCIKCEQAPGSTGLRNGLCACCIGEEIIARLDRTLEEKPSGVKLKDGFQSFSEQRRVDAQLREKSNQDLMSIRDDESRHPGQRAIAKEILEGRWTAVFGNSSHGGEQ